MIKSSEWKHRLTIKHVMEKQLFRKLYRPMRITKVHEQKNRTMRGPRGERTLGIFLGNMSSFILSKNPLGDSLTPK